MSHVRPHGSVRRAMFGVHCCGWSCWSVRRCRKQRLAVRSSCFPLSACLRGTSAGVFVVLSLSVTATATAGPAPVGAAPGTAPPSVAAPRPVPAPVKAADPVQKTVTPSSVLVRLGDVAPGTQLRPPAPAPRPATATPKAAAGTPSRASRSKARKLTPRAIAAAKVAAAGWSAEQFRCLDRLWTKESDWKITRGQEGPADNPTSSAYGIPQALPGRKMASPARTGGRTPPRRSAGAWATSPTAMALPARPGRTRRPTTGTER